MNKKILVPTVLFLTMLPASVYILSNERATQPEETEEETGVTASTPILYFSDQCTHCAALDVWLEENKVAETVPYEHKNIRIDNANRLELSEKAALCGLSGNVELPFLWDGANGDECYEGQVEVAEYFQDKINVN